MYFSTIKRENISIGLNITTMNGTNIAAYIRYGMKSTIITYMYFEI